MDLNSLINEIQCKGVDEIGFCSLEGLSLENLKGFSYAISLSIRLLDTIIEEIEGKPTFTYFHHYRTVNTFIDQTTLWISKQIERTGYKALPIPASQTIKMDNKQYHGLFQHKTAAVLSGLGWIGKSGLYISNVHGPRIRLGTVLTNMELPVSSHHIVSRCGDCDLCVRACPAMALHGVEWKIGMKREDILDAKACSDYMREHFMHIGRGSVCGVCIKVCPYGKRK